MTVRALKQLLLIMTHLSPLSICTAQEGQYYFSDFESDDGGLTGIGSWEWGPPFAGPDTAFSDFLCWGTNLMGDYSERTEIYLDTPPIDLANAMFPELSFMHWFQFEADGPFIGDGGNVKISVDGGPFEIIEPFWDYDGTVQSADNPLNGEPVFSGFINGNFWHLRQFTLEPYVGSTVVIRFHVGSDANINFPGWYIDDLRIEENNTVDVAVRSIDNPQEKTIVRSLSLAPAATVYNAHSGTQNFDVEMSIELNGVQEYYERASVQNLAPNEKSQMILRAWKPSAAGSFHLFVRTLLPDDTDVSNDTLSFSGEVISTLFTNVNSLVGLSRNGRAASWGDFDNDGDEDLVYLHSAILYENNGGDTFEEVFIELSEVVESAESVSWIDFDNDGFLDLALASHFQPLLYQNDSGGQLNSVTSRAGLLDNIALTNSASWADYDNDGFIDWYYSDADRETGVLYRNNRDGTFNDTAHLAGLDLPSTESGTTQGMSWCDYDNDGDIDVFVSNVLGNNRLFNNDGNGVFTDMAETAGILDAGNSWSWGADWGDYDNDGFFDLYVARSKSSEPELPNRLYRNNGDGAFAEIGLDLDVAGSGLSKATRWLDYDNDGYLDLFVLNTDRPHQLFLNNRDDTFSQASDLFLQSVGSRGFAASLADYDRDGDLDMFVDGRLYKNNNSSGNHWLHVKAIGTVSNWAAIGTRARIVTDGLAQIREVNGGTGKTQNSLPVEFGLGSQTSVDSLIVRWPSGIMDIATNVEVNQMVTVVEGQGVVSGIGDKQVAVPDRFNLAQNFPNPFNPSTIIQFDLPRESHIKITIFNLLGQLITTLIDEEKPEGRHQVPWDGKNDAGRRVTSGMYIYKLEMEGFSKSKRMLLVK